MTPPGSDPQAWLETDAIRRVSDIAFGVMLLIIGVFALWHATNYAAGSWARPGPRAFPAVVAGLLCVAAVVLLLRAALRRSPPVRRSRLLHVTIVAAAIVVLVFATRTWGAPLSRYFGPAEFTALIALQLAVATTLAHSSRIRAAGMALLGLLLSSVGTDLNSGVSRFTMGVEGLVDGIGAEIVLVGLFVVGDALACLVSPPLFLRTYTRLFTAWQAPRIPLPVALVMRLAAALALAGACYYAYALSHSYVDVASILVFGILGVAGKIFGWNRFLLHMGFALGVLLEENIRRALLLSGGDPSALLRRPFSGTLLVATMAVLAIAVVFSVRRAARSREPHPAETDHANSLTDEASQIRRPR
jgi:TctA family transporter